MIRSYVRVVSIVMLMAGCIKNDYFGKSSLKQILYIQLTEQTGNARIVQDSLRIYVTANANANLQQLSIDSVVLSTFASIHPPIGESLNFSSPTIITVTAEDGSTADYTVLVTKEGSQPQLENSSFDEWYTPSGKNYPEPGKDASTIWASANAGVTTTNSSNFNTTPLQISGSDYAAKLVTKDLGALAQITGQRMGAATLFTGKFVLNIADPPSSAQFGVSFTARPVSFSIDYSYQAGSPYKSGTNVTLNKIDSADIYVLLENRDAPGAVKRIATGWYRTGNTNGSGLSTIIVPILYGALPVNTPVYQLPANGLYGSPNEKITHISVVFASSANGILYEGGVNSTLIVNNFRLNY